jgi:hypothetical protein
MSPQQPVMATSPPHQPFPLSSIQPAAHLQLFEGTMGAPVHGGNSRTHPQQTHDMNVVHVSRLKQKQKFAKLPKQQRTTKDVEVALVAGGGGGPAADTKSGEAVVPQVFIKFVQCSWS